VSRLRLAAEITVVALGAVWYAAVLYRTWPVGLAYWPLWVLAYVVLRRPWNWMLDELTVRRAARDTAHRPT
jgi:hypothetical protein